ncbi:MAG TPA: DUF305 domain-containing protein, partial [Longimicrobiaceae bacterium]
MTISIRQTAIALAAVVVSACAGAAQTPSQPAPAGHEHAPRGGTTGSGGYPWTAADAHFMTAMIGHHAQAIVMSRMAPTHGASPAVQTL